MTAMLAASDFGGLLGTIFFIALLVGLKLLEVVFRKITESKHRDKLGDDVRIVEEDVRPTTGGSYLPYEETAEEIFGDYIKLRKRVAEAKRAPSRPRPRAVPIPVTEIIPDVVVIDEPVVRRQARAPIAPAPPVPRRAAMSVEEARRAFVASLIFGPPKSRARVPGSR